MLKLSRGSEVKSANAKQSQLYLIQGVMKMTESEYRYLVKDILDVKIGEGNLECQNLFSRLMRKHRGKRRVDAISGFLIGDALLLFKEERVGVPRRFLFVDSERARMFEAEGFRLK